MRTCSSQTLRRGLTGAVALLTLTGGTAEPPFVSWAEQLAQQEHLRVAAVASGQLDSDASIEQAALLCDPAGSLRGYWLIEKDPHHRWVVAFELSQPVECAASRRTESLHGSIEVTDHVGHNSVTERLVWRDASPVLLSASSLQPMPPGDETLVASTGPEPGTTPNVAVYGADHWTGPADASLHTNARRLPDGRFRIQLTTTDDVRLTIPGGVDEHAFLGTDHFELWWTQPEPTCTARPGHLCGVRQLGIAFRDDGTLDARWLYPLNCDDTLPTITGNPSQLDVDLPLAALSNSEGGGQWGRFTAAYSDSDTPHGEQETIIATSHLRWGRPDTFGYIAAWPRNHRWPPPSVGKLFCDAWPIEEGHRFR